MSKKINITLNPARRAGGLHKETREMVLKNFGNYNRDNLYSLDRLCCGLHNRIDENDRYMLLKSTCGGTDVWYVIYNKETRSICLELNVCVYDEHTISLSKEDTDVLEIAFTKLGSNWHTSNYEFLDKKTYGIYIKENAMPYAKNVEISDDEAGYAQDSHGIYVTEKIVDNTDKPEDELKADKWKSHIIYCNLF